MLPKTVILFYIVNSILHISHLTSHEVIIPDGNFETSPPKLQILCYNLDYIF